MRTNLFTIALITFLVFGFSSEGKAQCKPFVKTTCIPMLEPYIHDGSYQAAIMSEGEEAEVYKTVFADQDYRLLVCYDPIFPEVEFVVTDIHRNVLFDSRKNGNIQIWDFRSGASQQIKVTVRVPESKKKKGDDAEKVEKAVGCVGVFFGLKES